MNYLDTEKMLNAQSHKFSGVLVPSSVRIVRFSDMFLNPFNQNIVSNHLKTQETAFNGINQIILILSRRHEAFGYIKRLGFYLKCSFFPPHALPPSIPIFL